MNFNTFSMLGSLHDLISLMERELLLLNLTGTTFKRSNYSYLKIQSEYILWGSKCLVLFKSFLLKIDSTTFWSQTTDFSINKEHAFFKILTADAIFISTLPLRYCLCNFHFYLKIKFWDPIFKWIIFNSSSKSSGAKRKVGHSRRVFPKRKSWVQGAEMPWAFFQDKCFAPWIPTHFKGGTEWEAPNHWVLTSPLSVVFLKLGLYWPFAMW